MRILKEKFRQYFEKNSKNNNYSIKISSKEKISFLEQLSNLINSGIPLSNSLKIIMYQTKDKKISNFVKDIGEKLNKGSSLKDAFSSYKNIFNTFDLQVIEIGEVTGKLGNSVEKLKIKEEKAKDLKSKIVGALIYPMVIITLSIAMIIVFMIYVIPKITDMYKDAKVNLPDLTQWVINSSKFLSENIYYILTAIIGLVVFVIYFKTNKKTKIYWDKAILYIPLFGDLIKKKILAIFTDSLSSLLESGVMINKSLEISSKTTENDYYEKELNIILKKVSKGDSLSSLMGIDDIASGKSNFLFPIELASVVKIGEQTGNLGSLLNRSSLKFNKDIDNIVKNISTVIEPVVIIVVGGIIGTLIMAIMLPFFNMVNVV